MIIPHSANVEGAAKKERKFKEILIKEKFNNFNAPADAEGGWFIYILKKLALSPLQKFRTFFKMLRSG